MELKIKRALISVSDKSGITEFAAMLSQLGIEILSTGGTAKLLRSAKIKVRDVSDFTGAPEMMDGRVKTLHPKVHAGLLCLRDNPKHIEEAQKNGIEFIDMLVVNLYPFESTVSDPDVDLEDAIENIDIGGPAMLRAAAKNYKHTVVITDPLDYYPVLKEIEQQGDVSERTRERLCATTFARTAAYDSAIDRFLNGRFNKQSPLWARYTDGAHLRYGENSHQEAIAYRDPACQETSLMRAHVLHGKDMSYNNYVDGDAALEAAKDLWDYPACVVVKHTNPCGYATGATLAEAMQKAWEGDQVSAFGSVIACTRKVDLETAQFLKGRFVEVLIAPGYEPDALDFLTNKSKDIRLLQIEDFKGFSSAYSYRSIVGGMLEQTRDNKVFDKFDSVTKKAFPEDMKPLAQFAYKACKHTKSNAIVLAREYKKGFFQVLGMGAGQPNRIDSLKKLAYPRALENLKNETAEGGNKADFDKFARAEISRTVMASDAFFPFDDTVREAAKIGIRYIVQPGGAKRDLESIEACNELEVAMAFTGMRHFRH